MHFDVAERAFRVAGVRNCARSVRFAWPASVWCDVVRRWAGIVLRGRRRESCAAAETIGFCGPVRDIACVCVSGCVRRGELVAGAGNRWIYGCERSGRLTQLGDASILLDVSGGAVPLGVAWSVSRWARSAIGISDERVSVNVSDSCFNTNLKRICLRLRISRGI